MITTADLVSTRGRWSPRVAPLVGAARWLTVGGIAWGAFAFGAVYPWAYWPLVVAAVAIALVGLLTPAAVSWRLLQLTPLAIALAAFAAAAVVQIVPLPITIVRAISPEAPSIVSQLDLTAQLGLTSHPLSIEPATTRRAVVVIAALAALVIGTARLLSILGAAAVARAIVTIGAVLALTAILFEPISNQRVYGFWLPLQGGNPFGPFVNKNHFAGWMLMGLPVAVAVLCDRLTRGLQGTRPGLRDKAVWLSTADGNRLLLLIGAVAVMTLSLILTMSRSGITAGLLAIVGLVLTARPGVRAYRIAAVGVVFTLLLLAVGRVGVDAITTRFASGEVSAIGGRTEIWGEALDIASRYPLAGTGLNTFGISMLFYQEITPTVHYGQAHNDYLQLAAEGGLLLIAPAAICLVMFARAVRRRFAEESSTSTYWIRRGAVVGILAIGLQELVDFSLQMPGNAFLFAVLCGIALHRTPPRRL